MEIERTRVCGEALKSHLEEKSPDCARAIAAAAELRALVLYEPALVVLVAATDKHGRRSVRAYVRSATTTPAALILGAHPTCDVPCVEGAALRHVAFVFDPKEQPGWISAYDLNTTEGITVDEEKGIRTAKSLRTLRLRAGSADVFALALDAGEPVDKDALTSLVHITDAYIFKFQSEERPFAFAQAKGAPIQRSRDGITLVEAMPTSSAALSLSPTAAELERGLLLGRYDRCQGRLDDGMVSRVHALVLKRKDELLVIDTASTNGTDVIFGAAQVDLGILRRATIAPRTVTLKLGASIVEIR